jgi:hypothetical protein
VAQTPVPPARSADPAEARLHSDVAALAREAGVFGGVELRLDGGGRPVLDCAARDSAAPATYRLGFDGANLWVSLFTADRWLSQSIEADLVHTGDKLEELIEEELVDQGVEGVRPRVEHFRSEDKLFTFRSPVPARAADPASSAMAARFLLAYEACFRNLGDMAGGDDDRRAAAPGGG